MARPTIQGWVWVMVAMGIVIGPIAETVAPSLMKLVVSPVKRLVAMARPVPLCMKAGNTPMNQSAR